MRCLIFILVLAAGCSVPPDIVYPTHDGDFSLLVLPREPLQVWADEEQAEAVSIVGELPPKAYFLSHARRLSAFGLKPGPLSLASDGVRLGPPLESYVLELDEGASAFRPIATPEFIDNLSFDCPDCVLPRCPQFVTQLLQLDPMLPDKTKVVFVTSWTEDRTLVGVTTGDIFAIVACPTCEGEVRVEYLGRSPHELFSGAYVEPYLYLGTSQGSLLQVSNFETFDGPSLMELGCRINWLDPIEDVIFLSGPCAVARWAPTDPWPPVQIETGTSSVRRSHAQSRDEARFYRRYRPEMLKLTKDGLHSEGLPSTIEWVTAAFTGPRGSIAVAAQDGQGQRRLLERVDDNWIVSELVGPGGQDIFIAQPVPGGMIYGASRRFVGAHLWSGEACGEAFAVQDPVYLAKGPGDSWVLGALRSTQVAVVSLDF